MKLSTLAYGAIKVRWQWSKQQWVKNLLVKSLWMRNRGRWGAGFRYPLLRYPFIADLPFKRIISHSSVSLQVYQSVVVAFPLAENSIQLDHPGCHGPALIHFVKAPSVSNMIPGWW